MDTAFKFDLPTFDRKEENQWGKGIVCIMELNLKLYLQINVNFKFKLCSLKFKSSIPKF
jgi:hypothetical protein